MHDVSSFGYLEVSHIVVSFIYVNADTEFDIKGVSVMPNFAKNGVGWHNILKAYTLCKLTSTMTMICIAFLDHFSYDANQHHFEHQLALCSAINADKWCCLAFTSEGSFHCIVSCQNWRQLVLWFRLT